MLPDGHGDAASGPVRAIMPADPPPNISARLARWRERFAAASALDARLAAARLIVFGAALALGDAVWQTSWSAWLLLVPAADSSRSRCGTNRHPRAGRSAALVGFYERGVARIEDRWTGNGATGERYRSRHHPYANDLDLFGRGSLFELLSLARTRTGEDTLAGWLTAAAAPAAVAERQAGVRELTPRSTCARSCRSRRGSRARTSRTALLAWAEAPPALSPPCCAGVALAVTAFTLAALVYWYRAGEVTLFFRHRGADGVRAALRAEGGTDAPRRRRARARSDGAAAGADAARARAVLLGPARGAAAELRETGPQASTAIARLRRLSEMHDWQHNMVFAASRCC